MLLSGITAEVWMKPGVSAADALAQAGAFYRKSDPKGAVTVILGAGNIASIPPLDVLYKLLAEGSVCILKMNPVNEYLGPILERAFAEFIECGYLRITYGGAQAGAYLCSHDLVDAVHVTGSERTHDAIVFGTDAEAARRKARNEPLLRKPITSELGNVSPTIVVPGNWSADDIRFQAENIATQKAHNAGFNCIAAQALILPRDWEHTRALVQAVEDVFRRMEQRPEYYPGAAERRALLAGAQSPLRTIVRVDPSDMRHPAFTTETFSGVLAYTELSGDPRTYLRAAVDFANECLHGTLGANIIAHPHTQREMAEPLDEALESLRYGCVAINAWTGVGYFITETPWGAYPGHTPGNVGSGIGVVHNSYFLAGTEKSVVRAPFAPFPRSFATNERTLLPRPPWFVTNAKAAEVGRLLCEFECARTPLRAAAIAATAMQG